MYCRSEERDLMKKRQDSTCCLSPEVTKTVVHEVFIGVGRIRRSVEGQLFNVGCSYVCKFRNERRAHRATRVLRIEGVIVLEVVNNANQANRPRLVVGCQVILV